VQQAPNKLEQIKESTAKRFEESKVVALQLKDRALAITICDDVSLGMANQLLSQINQHFKVVEEKRKALKQPYLEAGKIIDEIAKQILTPLDEAIDSGKKKLKVWNEEQDKIRQEAQKAIDAEKNMITAIDNQLFGKIANCITKQQCIELAASINQKFPALESIKNFRKEAGDVKAKYLNLLQTKIETFEKIELRGPDIATQISKMREQEEVVKQQTIEAAQNVEDKKQDLSANLAVAAPKSQTRKVWKFEVKNLAEVPQSLLQINEAAVKEWMKANKESLKHDTVTNGIRFYIDEVPVLK
jgi:hypothetical protein